MTSDGGDALLFAIAAKRDLSWSAFKTVADAVLPLDTSLAPDARRTRTLAASLGDALGHWDVVTVDGTVRVCIAPPALARLPWPGLPRAVLCGSRSPDTLTALVTASASRGVMVSQRRLHAHAPARIEATAEAESQLVEFAASLDIRYHPEPAAWRLASASCSAREYLGALEWSEGRELNWPRREFDPDRLAFGSVIEGSGERHAAAGQLRLVSYEHPAGWTRQDRLVCGGRSAVVDRSWARYAVLEEARTRVVQLDRRAGTVMVPRQLPLPRLIARALALCSGAPPTLAPGPGLGEHVYSQVPAAILDEVAAKLGQDH